MPCSDCSHLLILDHDNEKLLCPNCLDIKMADRDVLEEKIERDRQLLRDENLVQLMRDYDKGHLLLYLIERLNKVSYGLYCPTNLSGSVVGRLTAIPPAATFLRRHDDFLILLPSDHS
jgi:hypothetical protein